MRRVKIAAGLSRADYGRLGDQVAEATAAGVDYIHSDQVDMEVLPHFELMGGAHVIRGIRPFTDLPIEAHIYVRRISVAWIDELAEAGANLIILPVEYTLGGPLNFLIDEIHKNGCRAGMMVTNGSPLCLVEEALYWVERLHLLTHDIDIPNGYHALRESQLPMIRRARQMIDERGLDCELCCDGGLTPENVHKVVAAGVDVVEMSRPIFQAPEGITTAVKRIREVLDAASAQCGG